MLTKLQDSAPAMPPARVKEVMAAEFGPRWRRRFLDFDDTAVAAASIGQVHRATWRDGRDVAVKIRPGGRKGAAVRPVQRAQSGPAGHPDPRDRHRPDPRGVAGADVRGAGLLARSPAQKAFAKGFEGDPNVAVPGVIDGTERVLVTEWMDGIPLSSIIADGTQEQRDLAGRLHRVPPRRAWAMRFSHADPHLGNFRLLEDGRLGVLDFGAVKHLPGGLPDDMGRPLTLALDDDAGATLAGLREIGFVRDGIDVDAQRLLDYLQPFIDPLRTDTFHFSRDWIRDVFAHINDPRKPNYAVGMRLNLPAEYLLIHRVWLGGIGVLCQLGATVPGRAKVAAHIPGADLPPVDEECERAPAAAARRAGHRFASGPLIACPPMQSTRPNRPSEGHHRTATRRP